MKKKNIKKIVSGIFLTAVLCMESVAAFGASDIDGINNFNMNDTNTFVDDTASSVWGIPVDGNLSSDSIDTSGKTDFTQQKIVVLHRQDGSVYKTLTVKRGKVKLPSMANPKGYTFMGWSRKQGKKVNPEYEAGDIFYTDQKTDLYPVIFDRSKEPDLTRKDITVPKGYDRIIFVGDSRTYALSRLVEQEFGASSFKKVSFVAKTGSTLSWVKGSGMTQVMNLLEKNKRNGQYVKTAVIFNHGVNSIKHNNGDVNVNKLINNYCSYMKKIGPKLKEKNCDLYYMSVNPVNSGKKDVSTLRKSEEVRQLNNGIRKGLKGMYYFIDTYGYLMKNGYGTASKLVLQEKDDGTHYTYTTYKRILAYCMRYLEKKKRS